MNCQALTSLSLKEVWFILAVQIMNEVPSRKETPFFGVKLGKESRQCLIVYNDLPTSAKNLNISA